MKKHISVCIPTYNQADYLEKAVLSAYNQTLQPFEIIVSNDCSTDHTEALLHSLETRIPVLKVIHQPVNVGIAKNTDQCLRNATCDFIVRLDSDDCLYPKFLEKVSAALSEFPEAGYAHTAVQEIDQFDQPTRVRRLFRKSKFWSGDEALKAAVYGYKVAANILMFRRAALERIHYLKDCPNFGEDYYMTAAISAAGYGNVYIDEILSCYRVWVDSKNVRLRRKYDEITGIRRVFEEVLTPAFLNRKWNLRKLRKQRANFAATHAQCLATNLYSKEEKITLVQALSALSASPKAKLFSWMYLNNYGGILMHFNALNRTTKNFVKKTFFSRA